jgi:7,8-dihydropterin-6-yl-methyl-4-(beta-D-ribofuranosyl)aminobenzene 5'-phosphate synthase
MKPMASAMAKSLRLNVVVENCASTNRPDVWGQHGLCLSVEADLGAQKMYLLMDCGPSPEVTLHNIDLLGIDLGLTDAIVLSHGHYDHTGGLFGVLVRAGRRIPVLAHPDIQSPKLKTRPFLKYIGPPFTAQQAESAGAVMLYSKTSIKLAEGIFTTGEVQRDTSFEKAEGFRTLEGDAFKEDPIMDDQSLVVNIPDKGLVIIAGCAHSGIINTVQQAQRLSGVSEIYAIVGGFHLLGASDERLDSTVNELMKLNPKVLRPGHCTGARAVCRLMQAFKDRCEPLCSGDVIEL